LATPTLIAGLGSQPRDRSGRTAAPTPSAFRAAVFGFEVDAFWPGTRLVVELDGYAFHRTRGAFERDRARDTALQVAGYRVLRVTSRRLVEEPVAVADAIRSLLEQMDERPISTLSDL
jgi:very-short-patch-repair endonuclease